ncbi:hypothetical protein [Blastococcus montanus]|uniref:hypothetical protein n=1 Tax=Blastococcus montanus TaxID=3144973 RepID=UPI00320819FD
MTIASQNPPLPAPAAAAGPAVADVTALLPSREALLGQLAAQLPEAAERPASLIALGLLRRDDGWPAPQSTLAQVTTLLARSVRGDDWLAFSGPAEFGIVLAGPPSAAHAAASRLVVAVADQGIPGLWAAAGIAPVDPALSAGEVFRRATLSLTAARRVGAGTVIRYREPA